MTNVGYLLNNLLPLRLGDVVRAYLCAQVEGCSGATVLATLVVERLADVVTILLGVLLVLRTVTLDSSVMAAARHAGLLAALAGFVILVAAWQRKRANGLLTSLSRKLPDSWQLSTTRPRPDGW